MNLLARYMHWLHTRWPAGTVERLPEVGPDGRTAVPGLYVVGDLGGVPLLKFSSDSGARAVAAIVAEPGFERERAGKPAGAADLVIVGAGVSGVAAALAARRAGLDYRIVEASEPFSTLVNFPKGKPIYTYPLDMKPAGDLQLRAEVKEALLDEVRAQAAGITPIQARCEAVERRGGLLVCRLADRPASRRPASRREASPCGRKEGTDASPPGREEGREPLSALRVIVAIGRSGNFRRLGVPGEDLEKVYNRLHDPKDFAGRRVLVVGGGDSAVEAAIALAEAGAEVSLSYRGAELSRPKPANVERLEERLRALPPGRLRLRLSSEVIEIGPAQVVLETPEGRTALDNDVVFTMIGREPPLDFLRRSGVPIRGEWTARRVLGLLAFFALCAFVYSWKADTWVNHLFKARGLFPFNVPAAGSSALGKALTGALREPGFYYSLAYSLAIVLFGVRRIRRRRMPYVTRQTLTLMAVQLVPLFFLPYLVLPWMGHAGLFQSGALKVVGDQLFPGGSYWRAFGLILAWPLFLWNVFNWQPLSWWLAISLVQTFVVIPLIVWRWGKGAYCGWICSCGALAETLGDEHRGRMPHGPLWNRLNMLGQAILALCLLLLIARTVAWAAPGSAAGRLLGRLYDQAFYSHSLYDYYHVVDLFLAGMVGVGLYFWFSGRVWCRFACPLAALMHIYARFSRFRIFADKKKCISCNVCTSVCHMGIDVMGFAQRGLPMADPQCVRCSACVGSCPTGVLRFGAEGSAGSGGAPRYDRVPASGFELVQIRRKPTAG